MKDFGYTIHADRQIDYDTNNKKYIDLIRKLEPSIHYCIACGSCTATCSAGHFTGFNIRKVQTFLRRGEIKTIREEIEKCMLCGKCQLVCPRNINIRNMILAIHTAFQNPGQ
jgi:heterodisulfide reductase subunit C